MPLFRAGNLCWELAPTCLLDAFLLKGGDPAARSRTATLLRLHPSHGPHRGRRPPCGGLRQVFWDWLPVAGWLPSVLAIVARV